MNLASTRKQHAMLRVLAADGAIFFILFAGYLYLRIRAASWPEALHFPSAVMALAMTLFVFSGSFTMNAAKNAQLKADPLLATRLIAATVGVWVMFLICDAMEWGRLLFFEKPPVLFAETFCLLTGYHALHLLGGLPYLITAAAKVDKSDIGAAALFVHFTNVIWLAVFAAIYVFGTDLTGF